MKTRRSKASRSRRFADRQAPENRALAFEILERRLVLDLNYFWVGGGAGDEWADLANWELSNGSAPTTPTDSTDATYFDTGPDPAGIKDVSISGAANNDYAAGSVDVHGSGTAQFFLMGHVLNVGPDPSGNKYAFRVQADNDDETGAAPSAVIDDSFARAGLLNAAGIIVGGNSEASLSVNSARVTSTTLSVGSTSDLYDQPGQVTLDNGADAEMTGNVDIALGTVKVDGSSLLGAANIYVGERQAALLNAEELSELDVLPGSRVASDGVVLIGGKANVKQGYGLVHLYGGGAALDSGKVTSVGVGTRRKRGQNYFI